MSSFISISKKQEETASQEIVLRYIAVSVMRPVNESKAAFGRLPSNQRGGMNLPNSETDGVPDPCFIPILSSNTCCIVKLRN